jgi:hypothetical protein
MVYCVTGYCSFLFLSLLVCDASLYFDTRTMALPYLATMFLVLSIMTEWVRKNRSQEKSWRWFAFDCAIAVLLTLQLINGVIWLRLSYLSGIGFASDRWHQSELLKFARNAPMTTPIVSNAPDFIYTLTGRSAAMIPHKIDPATRQPNKLYAEAIMTMREQLMQMNAVVVYFSDDSRLWYQPSITELESNLALKKIKPVSDGAIYELKRGTPEVRK